MMHHMIVAGAGVVGLVIAWIAVQAAVRHHSPEMNGDSDVLACHTCGSPDACSTCAHADTRENPSTHHKS